MGRGTAVQRNADGAHAHAEAGRDRRLDELRAGSSASTSSARSSTAGCTSWTRSATSWSTSRSSSTIRCGGRTARSISTTTSGPYRIDSPGGRRELDDAVGQIASTPLDRTRPLWEMYFIEGLANGRIAVLGKIHHALADGVASANLMARGMDLQTGPRTKATPTQPIPAPTKRRARAHRVRRSHAPDRPVAGRRCATPHRA